MTPLAPFFGISTSAVIECDLFFRLMKTFSDIPSIPG